MEIVATGAASFLGGHLIRFLLDQGATVFATYRTRNTRLDALQNLPRVRLIHLDVGERDDFRKLPERADALIHVAAMSVPGRRGIEDLFSANVIGTQNVVRYAQGARVKKIIYSSTVSVYGDVKGPTLTEAAPIINPSDYGLTKYLAERILAEAKDDISSVALRLPGVLGKHAHRAWIPTLVADVLGGKRVVDIYNPNSTFNNAAHVDEISRFIWRLINSSLTGFEALNVAADGQMTIQEIIDLIAEVLGERIDVTKRPGRKPSFTISSARAKRLGYETRSIQQILRSYFFEAGLSKSEASGR